MSSELSSNSQMKIAPTVNDLVTIIQEKRSVVKSARSLLVAISGIDGSGKGYVTEKITTETNRKGLKAISRSEALRDRH